jgi:C1A family cysteine protease
MPDGQKVWIMRNSYGSRFGMNGDLYVQRGGNAFNTEEHITVFDAELIV